MSLFEQARKISPRLPRCVGREIKILNKVCAADFIAEEGEKGERKKRKVF
jgi:hypothetical protein